MPDVQRPPLELLRSPWRPLIVAFVNRVRPVLAAVPGMSVNSWWRSALENARVGGDRESQHLFALAADLGGSRDQVEHAIQHARELGLIAVDFGGFVHAQLFLDGALARAGVRFPRVLVV